MLTYLCPTRKKLFKKSRLVETKCVKKNKYFPKQFKSVTSIYVVAEQAKYDSK